MLSMNRIILLAPVVWVSGLFIVFFHFALFIKALILTVKRGMKIRVDYLLLVFIVWYFFSIIISILVLDYSSERYFASFYNLSVWMLGLISYSIALQEDGKSKGRSAKAAIWILVFMLAVYFFFLVTAEGSVIKRSIISILFDVNEGPPLLVDSLKLKILTSDWVSGEYSVRSSILAPYPTASAVTAYLLYALIIYLRKSNNLAYFVFVFTVASILVVASASRIVILSFMIFNLLLYGLFLISKLKQKKTSLLVVLIFIVFVSIIIVVGTDIVNAIISVRSGSSSLRFEVYAETLKYSMDVNPISGIGIKPRTDDFPIPIGSHSTLIGLILKTGVVGLFLFASFYFTQLSRYFSIIFTRQGRHPISLLVSFLPFLMFEDLDAPVFVAILFFYLLGIYNSYGKFDLH